VTPVDTFANELRKWWSFDGGQMHTHSWHSREDFIEQKLPEMLSSVVAVPVADWRVVADEDVLIYVVHDNAQYETDVKKRLAEWEGWFVGRWIKHNKGGWTWHGMLGRVTHVAPLPPRPSLALTSNQRGGE
jgi:hypothetical protein